ncbi:hypothetical protein N657DRAFT_674944 [Parathielavia appendiculata]|uniref:Uncharacterized protein n=1 Tax=Parathielavia appendiculata TaxID=2587402 RepID=A0AAN6TSE8_9PEZI|nr:hypothetical protein N657DRAFT_674944 [Parathielavia appendiculata]
MATTPGATAASNVITRRAEGSLPRFIPVPDRFTDMYRWTNESCGPKSYPCTNLQNPPATDYPLSYTGVAIEESVSVDGSKTERDVACCLEGYSFTFNGPPDFLATTSVEYPLVGPFHYVARTPMLPGPRRSSLDRDRDREPRPAEHS